MRPPLPLKAEHLFDLNEFPVRVNWLRVRSAKPFAMGHHNAIEFQFIKRGQGAYFVNGRQYALRKYSLLVIFPNQVHYFIPSPDGYLEKVHLMFPWKRLRTILGPAYFKPDFPPHLRLSESEAITLELILNRIQEEKKHQEEYWTEIIEARLKEFVFFVKRISCRPQPPHRENPLVSQLANYLEQHYAQPLNLARVARQFGFSASYLSRLFKTYSGVGLKQYILQRRINEAKHLLETQPAFRVSAIAELVGFEDFGVFNRAFKQTAGLTPSMYRHVVRRANNNPGPERLARLTQPCR